MLDNECIGCGCTDSKACVKNDTPCHWLALDKAMGVGVCSNCQDKLPQLEAQQAELAELAKENDAE